MDDLPIAASDAGNKPISTNPTNLPAGKAGNPISTNKEKEGIGLINSELSLTEIGGPEFELPKEVIRVGVGMTPGTVPISPKAANLGVKPAGDNVTLGNGKSASLPLTDEQIAQGLKRGVNNSWRWLSEWCRRRLKQIGLLK